MKTNIKKILKLATLLVTSLLIATASATIYSYMYIEGSGTITSGELKWVLGTNAPSGASIQGAYVKNLNISVPVNSIRNITDCLRITNEDDASHTFDLEVIVVGGDASNFTTFDLVVYDSTGARLATLNVKQSGSSASGLTIDASETLYIRFEITPVTDATSGYFYFTVKLTYQ
jgi:hypothetical protein